jgi:hypothetical protein
VRPGEVYDGPKAIQTIDGITAHYADTATGPVRLVDHDGVFRVASDDDPVQGIPERLVELEVEDIHGNAATEA